MNCVAANISSHPSQYPWGTGNVFFNPSLEGGVCLGDLSGRAIRRIVHSHTDSLPKEWMVGRNGYILPQSYVDVKTVETVFRTPKRMNYFLNSSSKARKRSLTAEDNLPAFSDQTIVHALPDLCRSLFSKNHFSQLSSPEQTEFLRQLRFRFSADINQLARVCGLSYSAAAHLLDDV